ncbi:MAG: glycerate kinase [Firmicutes bacterium]|nr:glycerate kinase [Bacillota bacterium]
MSILSDSKLIINKALEAALPDTAVQKALSSLPPVSGRLILVATGKAAWQMAKAAHDVLEPATPSSSDDMLRFRRIDAGIVITKHGHSQGPIGNLLIREAGHPVPDASSYSATQEAIDLVASLTEEDLVLFLLSGGGSALFEKPLVPADEMDDITRQLLACGADIVEMNTLRKRLSAVKGGKFAKLCAPARVFSVVLSDIIGDPLDMIASGPAYPDSSTLDQAKAIVEKYRLKLSEQAQSLLREETPKELTNVETHVTGSVRQLCAAASETCIALGYKPVVLTASLSCEARDAGSFLASIAAYHAETKESLAFIAGGETVVHLTGKGLGGRNQEIALAAAKGIDGLENILIFSLGSDGTDGPTDAAGGIVTGETAAALRARGIDIDDVLHNNDAYHALGTVDALIMTGPTGTNVNDLTCLLIKR